MIKSPFRANLMALNVNFEFLVKIFHYSQNITKRG
jgi:hypothetical protein